MCLQASGLRAQQEVGTSYVMLCVVELTLCVVIDVVWSKDSWQVGFEMLTQSYQMEDQSVKTTVSERHRRCEKKVAAVDIQCCQPGKRTRKSPAIAGVGKRTGYGCLNHM